MKFCRHVELFSDRNFIITTLCILLWSISLPQCVISVVITITGISTSVSENNGSVQACVNITRGTLESTALVYVSTSASTGMDSATGMTIYIGTIHTCKKGGVGIARGGH